MAKGPKRREPGDEHVRHRLPRLPKRLATVFAHPLRAEILAMLNEQPGSPHDLTQRLGARGREESLDAIAYHVRVLAGNEAIEVVDTESAQGAMKHIYAANRKMLIDGDDWLQLSDQTQIEICANAIGEAAERAQAALEHRTMPQDDPVIVNLKMLVDEDGWEQIREHVKLAWQELDAVEPAAIDRTPDMAGRFPVTVSLLAYKSPADPGG